MEAPAPRVNTRYLVAPRPFESLPLLDFAADAQPLQRLAIRRTV
jgi:hypothetical protein